MTVEPRLFLDAPLGEGLTLPLEKDQAHYLITVMRRKAGDGVRVFNGRDGEWRATVAEAGRRNATLAIGAQTRPQTEAPDLVLYFAPVKKARTDFIVEKATELGVRSIIPVMTARTNAERVKTERLAAIAREAAEQTERLDIPLVGEPVALTALIKGWEPPRRLLYADESGDSQTEPWGGEAGRARPIAEALAELRAAHPTPTLPSRGGRDAGASAGDVSASPAQEGRGGGRFDPGPWAILIGPEGGFAPEERGLLRAQDFVVPVSLGPRILRADTAALAALTVWQSVLGDWG